MITDSQGHVPPQHHLHTVAVWSVTAKTDNTQMSAGCQWPMVGK
jgi:hypothetical protein